MFNYITNDATASKICPGGVLLYVEQGSQSQLQFRSEMGPVRPQVGSGGEDEEGRDVATCGLRLNPLHHQTLSVHPGQARLPQLW